MEEKVRDKIPPNLGIVQAVRNHDYSNQFLYFHSPSRTNSMKKLQYLLFLAIATLAIDASSYSQAIPPQNHQISLADAKRYIQNFRNNLTIDCSMKGGAFNREIFDRILAQPGCTAVRYYYAKTDNGTPTIVIVGVDTNGIDMESEVIGESSFPCPPICDTNGALSK
jgi:hypothetical protein